MKVVDIIGGYVIGVVVVFWGICHTYSKGYDLGYRHGTMDEKWKWEGIFWNEKN